LLLKPIVDDKGKLDGRVDDKFDKDPRVPFGEFSAVRRLAAVLSILTPYKGADFRHPAARR